jgi:chromate transporter
MDNVLFELFLVFLKIGTFGFGGGYAMISLIQDEVITKGWISTQDFLNLIALAQMTPGIVGTNVATFTGYKIGGIPGAILATVAVIAPGVIVAFILTIFISNVRENIYIQNILKIILPVVVGIIAAVAISLFKDSIIDFWGIIIAIITFLAVTIKKINLFILVLIGGALGILIYGILPDLLTNL